MKTRIAKREVNLAEYYDRRGVLGEIVPGRVEFALEEELRRNILQGRRARRLQNLSIKLDPAQIQALRKIATTKAIPYQTLIRQWLANEIRSELRLFPVPSQSQVSRVEDIVIFSTQCLAESGSEGRLLAKLPRLPLALGRGIQLKRLETSIAEMVMEACEPAGYKHFGPRQWSQLYAFVRSDPQDLAAYSWDPDNRIQECIAVSRLIRPTSIGFEYSARLQFHSNGDTTIIPGPVTGFGAHGYVLKPNDRDWLEEDDASQLAELWQRVDLSKLPDRLQRALWYHEYAARTELLAIRWGLMVTGVEALINTQKEQVSKQFKVRFRALAQRFCAENVSPSKADKIYSVRSQIAHGIRLNDLAGEHLDLYSLLESVLRGTLRAGLADRKTQQLFSSPAAVDQEWPLN